MLRTDGECLTNKVQTTLFNQEKVETNFFYTSNVTNGPSKAVTVVF
jgi:hypothetical protein